MSICPVCSPTELRCGMLGTLVLCIFLFAEETGLPLPLAPGEVFLVAAGVLIRSGAISPWSFLPLAIVSVTAGASVGFSWTRLVGAGGIRALARRLHVGHRLERFEQRLRSASPPGIFVARLLVPGMRVNTTLLAGALGVSRRVFTI